MSRENLRFNSVSLLFVGLASVRLSAGELTPAAHTLMQQYPGLRAVFENDRLTALSGVSFGVNVPASANLDDFVAGFLDSTADAFGVIGVDLVPRGSVDIADGGKRVYTYTQRIEGLPVHGSVVKIPVVMTAPERIGHVGIRLVPQPAAALPPDIIVATAAINAVLNGGHYPNIDTFGPAEKVIFEDGQRGLHRAWRFSGYAIGLGEAYRFFVDTNTGSLIGADNLILNGDVSGLVEGHATPCCAADNAVNPDSCPQNTALGGLHVTTDTGLTETVADNGFYRFQGLPDGTPVNVSASMLGDWVEVVNLAGDGLYLEQPATSPASGVDFLFNPTEPNCSSWPDEFSTAQVNAFVGVQKTHDWFRLWNGAHPMIDQPIEVFTNYGASCCNASHSSGTDPGPEDNYLFLYASSASSSNSECTFATCANSAFSTIISHEYGHYLVDQLVATPTGAFHEGAADVVGTMVWQTPLMGLDLRGTGVPIRDLSRNVPLNICGSEPPGCSNCGQVHCAGQPLAGAFWDLGERIGVNQASDIFIDFLQVTIGNVGQTVLSEVLAVDDNDADLSNGSPNMQAIIDSFVGDHGWEDPQCGQGEVIVRWEGAPGDPQEAIDYDVDYTKCPPDVILKRTTVGQEAITQWFVGRVVDNQPALLGKVSASWVGAAEDIRVRVGGTETFSTPCRSVTMVDIPAQSTQFWSSARLELTGHLHEGVKVSPSVALGVNHGKGGSLSGTIAGVGRNIQVASIGDGEGPGQLSVGSWIDGMTVETVPLGSTLNVNGFAGAGLNLIQGGLNGEIVIQNDIDETLPVQVNGDSAGTMRILGDLSGPPFDDPDDFDVEILFGGDMSGLIEAPGTWDNALLTIAGDLSGDVITGPTINQSQIRVFGDMSGDLSSNGRPPVLSVSGIFDGDTCGSPSFYPIALAFGPSATRCGQPICAGNPPAPLAEPSAVLKNRYLSFEVHDSLDRPSAIRVKLIAVDDFPVCDGEWRWVGEPRTIPEIGGNGQLTVAPLQAGAYVDIWSSSIDVLHVYGAEIRPKSTYEVVLVEERGLFDCASNAFTVNTGPWGDVLGAPSPNFVDIAGIVDAFRGIPTSVSLTRADLVPHVPNQVVNFDDIVAGVQAFRFDSYQMFGPTACH